MERTPDRTPDVEMQDADGNREETQDEQQVEHLQQGPEGAEQQLAAGQAAYRTTHGEEYRRPQNPVEGQAGQDMAPTSANTSTLRSQPEFYMTAVTPVDASTDPPPDNAECSICIEPLAEDIVKFHACGHMFHTVCVMSWFDQSAPRSGTKRGTCPNCRAELFEPDSQFGPASEPFWQPYRSDMFLYLIEPNGNLREIPFLLSTDSFAHPDLAGDAIRRRHHGTLPFRGAAPPPPHPGATPPSRQSVHRALSSQESRAVLAARAIAERRSLLQDPELNQGSSPAVQPLPEGDASRRLDVGRNDDTTARIAPTAPGDEQNGDAVGPSRTIPRDAVCVTESQAQRLRTREERLQDLQRDLFRRRDVASRNMENLEAEQRLLEERVVSIRQYRRLHIMERFASMITEPGGYRESSEEERARNERNRVALEAGIQPAGTSRYQTASSEPSGSAVNLGQPDRVGGTHQFSPGPMNGHENQGQTSANLAGSNRQSFDEFAIRGHVREEVSAELSARRALPTPRETSTPASTQTATGRRNGPLAGTFTDYAAETSRRDSNMRMPDVSRRRNPNPNSPRIGRPIDQHARETANRRTAMSQLPLRNSESVTGSDLDNNRYPRRSTPNLHVNETSGRLSSTWDAAAQGNSDSQVQHHRAALRYRPPPNQAMNVGWVPPPFPPNAGVEQPSARPANEEHSEDLFEQYDRGET